MHRAFTARPPRCFVPKSLLSSSLSRTPATATRAIHPFKRHTPDQKGQPINPVELLVSSKHLGWPFQLTEDFQSLEKAFLPPPDIDPELITQNEHTRSLDLAASLPANYQQLSDALKDLYSALNKDSVDDIVQVYVKLKALGGLYKLVDADIIPISRLLSSFLERAPKSTLRCNAEDMAVHLATRGLAEPLCAAMGFHLERDCEGAIYSLWHAYIQERRLTGKKNFVVRKRGKVEDGLLLYFGAAASIQDDYGSIVAAMCTTTTDIPPWRVNEFADRHLTLQSPLVRQRFRDYMAEAALSRDIRYFKPLMEDVMEIARLADDQALQTLWGSIQDGLNRKVFVARPISVPEGAPPPFVPQVISMKVWSLLIWAAVECRKVSYAESLVEAMVEYGIQPNIDIYNSLLYGFAKRGRVERMMEVVERIRAADLTPSVRSLMIIMSALFDARRLNQAMDVFKTIQAQSLDPRQEEELRAAYNIAINGLLRTQKVDEAYELFRGMQEGRGPSPDIVTLNTFLNRHTLMRDSKGVAEILRAIADTGLSPDIYTFTILFVGASRSKDEGVQRELLAQMKSLQVKPNNAFLTTVLQSIMNSDSADAIHTAKEFLTRMEADPDKAVRPTEVTYSAMMNSIDNLVERGVIKANIGYDHIMSLFQRMTMKGFKPNRVILSLLMKAHLRHSDPDSLRKAVSIFDKIVEEGEDNSRTWYIFLTGLEKRREHQLAKEKMRRVLKQPFSSKRSLLRVMDRISRA